MSGIFIAPSNPFLSIEPILVAGCATGSPQRKVPAAVVSPYVNGVAVNGPAERVQFDLALPPGDASMLRHFSDEPRQAGSSPLKPSGSAPGNVSRK